MQFLLEERSLTSIFGIKLNANLLSLILPFFLFLLVSYQLGPVLFTLQYFSYLLIVLVHELGHAFAGKLVGASIKGISFRWYGGVCRSSGKTLTHGEMFIFAAGGVVGQMILSVAGGLILAGAIALSLPSAISLISVFLIFNTLVMLLNLIPIGPMDGKLMLDCYRKVRKK